MLTMVSCEGTDAINHVFAPFNPPYREGISEGGYRKFWTTVANYYSDVARLIGEWMGVMPRDTTVMIVSSYGFRWGKTLFFSSRRRHTTFDCDWSSDVCSSD